MNNNLTTERALLAGCHGVFDRTSYITVGTKVDPLPYGEKAGQRANFKGKQMMTQPSKQGDTTDVYFDKKHHWVSDGDEYVDRLKYRETQKEKRKGFLSGDFKRRDEYSMVFRTEQYREQLKGEDKLAKQTLDKMEEEEEEEVMMEAAPKQYLYDLVYEKEDNNKTGASKIARDTKNKTHLSYERDFGSYRTTSMLTHAPPEEFNKPTYARKPVVRDTFYRKTNIFFPSDAAANPI